MSDEKKESALRAELIKAAAAKDLQDKLEELEKNIRRRAKDGEMAASKALREAKQETKKAIHEIDERFRHHHSKDNNLHMTNVATLILQGAPQFFSIVALISARRKELGIYIDSALVFDTHGGPFTNYFRRKGVELSHKFSSKKELDIPDLKYFADVNQNDVFEFYWIEDTFAGLFCDEKGKFSAKDSKATQEFLEKGIIQWLKTKDLCLVADDNKKYKLYNRSDVDEVNGKFTPKPGSEDANIKSDAYHTLRDADPGSLGEFLRTHFHDVTVELEPSALRPNT